MVILGFGHKARRGKDSAAQAIIEAHPGVDIRKYSFGQVLKQEVNIAAADAGGMFALFLKLAVSGLMLPSGQILKLPDWVTYDPNAPMDDPLCPFGKQRKLLQWWGTEYRRVGCNKFYWVQALAETLKCEQPTVALITDLRFQNEFLWIKANQGFTVRVDRLGYPDLDTNSGHVSEHELDGAPYDFVLTAPENGLEELKTDAVEIFRMICHGLEPQEVQVTEDVAA